MYNSKSITINSPVITVQEILRLDLEILWNKVFTNYMGNVGKRGLRI